MCLNIAILYKNLYIIIFDYNYIVYTGTVLLYNIKHLMVAAQKHGSCNGGTEAQPRRVTPRPKLGAVAERSYHTPPCQRPGEAARRSYPTPEARGGGREDQPRVQGAVAAWAQEGLEELSHVEGQEGWW